MCGVRILTYFLLRVSKHQINNISPNPGFRDEPIPGGDFSPSQFSSGLLMKWPDALARFCFHPPPMPSSHLILRKGV